MTELINEHSALLYRLRREIETIFIGEVEPLRLIVTFGNTTQFVKKIYKLPNNEIMIMPNTIKLDPISIDDVKSFDELVNIYNNLSS